MTRKGVWDLQEVRDKYLASLWVQEATYWSWGSANYGQLGTGNVNNKSSPIQITGKWNSVGGHRFGGTGVREDGTLWTWGLNTDGQLGLNNRTVKYDPAQVGTDTDWATATQSDGKDQYFIKTDGTMYAVGYNQNARLGISETTHTRISSPVQMPGTTWKWVMSAGAGAHAIKTDGTLWGWGMGTDGRIGINDAENYSSPKQLPGTDWAWVSESEVITIATRTDGTLWTWGQNSGYGGLGHNNRTNYSSPRQIPGTWSYAENNQIASQNEQVCAAIKGDGTLWMWGYNHTGALGQNSPMPAGSRSSPVQVGTETTWNGIEIGGTDPTVIASKSDGTLWAWGFAGEGRFGTNNNTPQSSPVQIGSGTKWSGDIHAGGGAMFALQKSLTPSQI